MLIRSAKDKSLHIESWTNEVTWEVTDFGRSRTNDKEYVSNVLILNSSHHVRDSSSASFELFGDHIRNGTMNWTVTLQQPENSYFWSSIRSGLKMF